MKFDLFNFGKIFSPRITDEPEEFQGHTKVGKTSFMSGKAMMSYRYPNKKKEEIKSSHNLSGDLCEL